MEHTKEAQEFFELFRNVRNEIATEDGYHLAAAIMLTFDRWNAWRYDMPDFDGEYLCYIRRNNECGTVSYYNQVCQCLINNWILKDSETVLAWRKVSNSGVVV
jgi:hypothetical protein